MFIRMIGVMITLHQKLQTLLASGWTQTAISKEVGVAQPTISRIISNKHSDPRASSAYAIDRLYDRVISEKVAA